MLLRIFSYCTVSSKIDFSIRLIAAWQPIQLQYYEYQNLLHQLDRNNNTNYELLFEQLATSGAQHVLVI